jgi:DNA replication protein DnaC
MLAVLAYANKYPAVKKPGLLLVGETGTGKTHLAVAVLRTLLARGHAGVFFDYLNLLARIRSSYNATLGTADREAFASALEAEILVLDDLGAHRAKDFVEDTVTYLITYRYNYRKPLIATTNLTDPAITGSVVEKAALGASQSYKDTLEQRIGERARSRLFEMCEVIRMPGVPDHRMKPTK